MRNIKTVIIILFMTLSFMKVNAQQAQLSDYIGTWTGTDNDGKGYTMILKSDLSAIIKNGSTTFSVKWFKPICDSKGTLKYDANGHGGVRLISDVPVSANNAMNSTAVSTVGNEFKTYIADVLFDPALTKMKMVVQFDGPQVNISFSK